MPDEPGYIGIGPEGGTFIPAAEAYGYALGRCLHGTREEREEFKGMLEGWYYSGNWLKAGEGI